jgi:hypothetical protein
VTVTERVVSIVRDRAAEASGRRKGYEIIEVDALLDGQPITFTQHKDFY